MQILEGGKKEFHRWDHYFKKSFIKPGQNKTNFVQYQQTNFSQLTVTYYSLIVNSTKIMWSKERFLSNKGRKKTFSFAYLQDDEKKGQEMESH